MKQININIIAPSNFEPEYATSGSAGADLKAFISSDIEIEPGNRSIISTGVYLEIPVGFEVQIRPRSGLSAKYGVTVLNSPGTIDSDYRGEIKVILINHGYNNFTVKSGDRIAQMIVAPVVQAVWYNQQSLAGTDRGAGGFGSTGT